MSHLQIFSRSRRQAPASAMSARPRSQRGFSLIELMVTVALLAIVARLAVPAFSGMVQRYQTSATMNGFLADVSAARSEASRLRRNVIMCPRSAAADPPAACTQDTIGNPGCGCANDGHWEDGWLSFADTNTNGALDNTDKLLTVENSLDRFESLRRDGNGNLPLGVAAVPNHSRIAFSQRGALLGPAATFALCLAGSDEDVMERARFLTMARTGRAAVRPAKDTETAPDTACRFGR